MGLFFDSENPKSEQKKEPIPMGQRLMKWIFGLFVAVVVLSITISILERIWVWLVVIGAVAVGLWIFFRLRSDTRDRW